MTHNVRWWRWLSGWFRPRKAPAAVRRRARRPADFADHGTAFGLDLSMAPPETHARDDAKTTARH